MYIMEKNKLLLFLLAMLPGVSHMYLGMLKKGVFLMSLFLAPIAFIFLTRGGLEIVSCILPVVWCYSFFDTFRYKSYTKEERFHIDIEFYENLKSFWLEEAQPMFLRRRKLVGWLCIFLAVYTFIYNIIGYFVNWFDRVLWFFYVMLSKVPTLLVVIFLFKLGIDLIRSEDDDFVAYQKESKKEYKKQKPQQAEQKYDVACEHCQKEAEIKQEQVIEPENDVQQAEEQQEIVQTQQPEINLEKGEKLVEPIFLEKRIED